MFDFLYYLFCNVIFDYLKYIWKKINNKLQKITNKRILTNERPLNEIAISKSIKSNYPREVPLPYIIDPIVKQKVFTTNERIHYTDIEKKYHVFRKIELLPLLDGTNTFFKELCKAMALSLQLEEDSNFLLLSLNKETNKLFSQVFSTFGGHNIKCQNITYKEGGWILSLFNKKKRSFGYGEVNSESLEGTKVILLEALLIFPEILTEAVEWLKSKGATIIGIVILFDGSGTLSNSTCIENTNNVIKGVSIDLKIFRANECNCNNKRLKALTYSNY